MSDTRRKTLGLPVRAEGEQRPVNPRRKPVRGTGSVGRRPPVAANAEPSASADKTDWRKKSQPKRSERPGGQSSGVPSDKLKPLSARNKRTDDRGNGVNGGKGSSSDLQRSKLGGRDESKSGLENQNPPTGNPSAAPAGVRVSKLMASRGLCSRREADDFIVRGWVYVDGERVSELGTRADPSAKITLDAQARAVQQRLMTILLHKPVGYVSGQPEPGCQPAVVLIQPENQRTSSDTPLFHASHLKGLAPAGRLDVDSTGLLALTQDGRVARRLIGENSKVDKEYLVRVEGQLIDNGLALLNHGLSLDGKPLKPARVEWLNDDQLRFVLNEGRKRQIRRMCELVGLRVTGLKRVRIGAVRLGDLPVGKWRYLRENETF
jgi:23S rRNA pseudouridine2604 synthase